MSPAVSCVCVCVCVESRGEPFLHFVTQASRLRASQSPRQEKGTRTWDLIRAPEAAAWKEHTPSALTFHQPQQVRSQVHQRGQKCTCSHVSRTGELEAVTHLHPQSPQGFPCGWLFSSQSYSSFWRCFHRVSETFQDVCCQTLFKFDIYRFTYLNCFFLHFKQLLSIKSKQNRW